jgi:hypothetical protein
MGKWLAIIQLILQLLEQFKGTNPSPNEIQIVLTAKAQEPTTQDRFQFSTDDWNELIPLILPLIEWLLKRRK